ncbi:hypothetical protein LCGC14_2956260, partial [marine sediment metagenome]
MRRIVYFIITAIILSSCGSSKKMLEKGNYDAAIQKAVKQIRKKPDSPKDIEALDKSYQVANQPSERELDVLLSTGEVVS